MKSGLNMRYFVLRPASHHAHDQHAHASRKAMLTYAATIEDEDPDLAAGLRKWVESEVKRNERMFEVFGVEYAGPERRRKTVDKEKPDDDDRV